MNQYAFILGRKPLLSIAEICQVLGSKNHITDIQRESLIASFEQPLENPQQSLDLLGGTIKIAKIIAETEKKTEEIPERITEFLIHKFSDRSKKVNYGISLYSFTQQHENFLKKTLIKVKKNMTEAKIKSRFINNNFKNLETAAIKGEKLLSEGCEIIIIESKDRYYIGETQALQDFENYSDRDYNRPARDARLGMLPPKLAQLMINLSGQQPLTHSGKDKTTKPGPLYDPFTGVGTILTEGLIKGYEVIGSDIDEQALEKAKKNIEWILPKITEKTDLTASPIELFVEDATKLAASDFAVSPGLIVTESYLGPPVRQVPLPENISKTFEHIRRTITGFFKAIHPIIKPGTPIIISLLFYRGKDRFIFIENLVPHIQKLGYNIVPLIPEEIKEKFELRLNAREGLLYDRPDQIVGREIWKFTKT